jgi:hypothetical protein
MVAPIRGIVDGEAHLDERQRTKQPDWSHDPIDSGKAPAERFETPAEDLGTGRPLVAPRHAHSDDEVDVSTKTRVEPARGQPRAHEVAPRPVRGIPPDAVDPDDPEARLYTSEPVETDEGTIVIQQQATGVDNVEGSGEWPDPHTRPQRPAPGAE